MRRFLALAVIAFLMLVVATPVNAGYLIIRIILEGGGGTETANPGMGPGSGPSRPGLPGLPGGSGSGRPNPPTGPGGPPPNPGGGLGGMGTAPTTSSPAQQDPSRCIVVVVPIEEDLGHSTPFYSKRQLNTESNPYWKPKLHTLYRGEKYITNMFTDGVSIQWYNDLLQRPAPKKTRGTEIRENFAKWQKTKPDSQQLLTILNDALAAGLVDEAVAYADELIEFTKEKKEGLTSDVSAFISAYGAIQKVLKTPASKPNPRADYWQKKLNAANTRTQNHYTLIFWDANDFDVKRRLDILEDNLRAFYIWHATRGIALPVPEIPLLAVLPRQSSEALSYAKALDAPTRLSADGYYSSEHEL